MTSSPQKVIPGASISQLAAQELLQAAKNAADSHGINVTVAITDAAGYLKALDRSDGAAFLTVEVAINKAWTASSYGVATHVWNDIVSNPKVAQLNNIARLMPVGGGCPIVFEGMLVGGIGISGGDAIQDQKTAEVALRALGFDVPE